MNLTASVSLVALVLAVGCEKSGPSAPQASGKASTAESELLASLPAGNTLLFGGNFMRFQKFMQSSPLGAMISMLDKTAPGLGEWTNCWADLTSMTMLGGVKFDAGKLDMRYAMKGVDIAGIEKCAQRANFAVTLDPDKKFISLAMNNGVGVVNMGYLVLPSGVLYTRQTMGFSTPGVVAGVDRAGLEAEIAGLSKGTAANDAALIAMMGKVDRKKAMWFVGSAAGTPIADKVGTFSGMFDIAPGLSLDISAELLDAALADKIADAVPQMKKQSKQLGSAVGAMLSALSFQRDGNKLRFALAVTDEQLEAVMQQLAPMMGGLGRKI